VEILEYLVQIRGAAAAGAQVRGLSGEMNKLAVSQERVGASGDAAAAGSERASASMGILGKVAKGLALGLVATGLEAVKMSTSFNHEMLRIRTDAGASTKELANMKKGVLDLAASGASMGQGPMSLAAGLYHLESLNIRGARAIHALTLASQEAAISGAPLEETVSALGSVLFVAIKGAGNMDHVMGLLNATVGTGNMRMVELVHSLGTGVLSSAKVAGLSIQDVTAGLAVFSDSGQEASSAAAQFATALHFFASPTSKATTALKSIGIAQFQLAQDMHKPNGMVVALKDLRDHLHGISQIRAEQVLNAILPGGRGRILLTEFTMLDRAMSKYRQQAAITGGFGASVAAQRHDPQTMLHTATAAGQASLIRLGNVLTPIVLPALIAVLHAGTQLLNWLTTLPAKIKDVTQWFNKLGVLWHGLAVVVGTLVAAFVTWRAGLVAWRTVVAIATVAQAAFNLVLDTNPIVLVVIALAALTAGLVYVYEHSKTVRNILATVGKFLSGVFHTAITGVTDALTFLWDQVLKPVGAFLGGAFNTAITTVKDALMFLWHQVIKPLSDLLGGALSTGLGIAKGAFDTLKGAINTLLSPIQTLLGGLQAIPNALNAINPFGGSGGPSVAPGTGVGSGPGSGPRGMYPGAGAPTPSSPPAHGTPGLPNVHHHALFSSRLTTPLALKTGSTAFHVHVESPIHVESPVYIDGREIARAHHRQVIKAMAAGA